MSIEDDSSAEFLTYLGTYEVLNISNKKHQRNIYNKHYIIKIIIHGLILTFMVIALLMYAWLPYYKARVQADDITVSVKSIKTLYPMECVFVGGYYGPLQCFRSTVTLSLITQREGLSVYSVGEIKSESDYWATLGLNPFSPIRQQVLYTLPAYMVVHDMMTYEYYATRKTSMNISFALEICLASDRSICIRHHQPVIVYNYTLANLTVPFLD